MLRGKCRHCSRSVNDRPGWWVAEDGHDPYPGECLAAPTELCLPCGGVGSFDPDPHDPRQERPRCEPCAGTGEVPGPHWPWRHPPT